MGEGLRERGEGLREWSLAVRLNPTHEYDVGQEATPLGSSDTWKSPKAQAAGAPGGSWNQDGGLLSRTWEYGGRGCLVAAGILAMRQCGWGHWPKQREGKK